MQGWRSGLIFVTAGQTFISFWVIARNSSMIFSSARWLAMARFIFSALPGVNPSGLSDLEAEAQCGSGVQCVKVVARPTSC
jgi:uncharacterized membrane protein YfbV (UPF0208 family)